MEEAPVVAVAPEKPKMWGPISGIFLGFAIFIGAQIIAGFLMGLIAGLSSANPETYYEENKILVNFFGAFLFASISMILIFWATKSYGSLTALKLKKVELKKLLWVFPAVVAYFYIAAIVFALVAYAFPGIDLQQEQDVGFAATASGIQMVMAFFALVIFAPISEEILFRGYIFQGVKRRFSWVIASLVSAVLFGVAHMQLNIGIDTFVLGMMACFLLEKTGSLWTAILLHGIKNFIAFYYVFVVG